MMQWMIFDSTGSAINSFDDEISAHVALRALVERDPDAREHLLLIAYDDDGCPVGDAVLVDDLPPATVSIVTTLWLQLPDTGGVRGRSDNRYHGGSPVVARPPDVVRAGESAIA